MSGSTKCLVRAWSLLATSHTSVFTHTFSSLPFGATRVAVLLTSGLPPLTLQQSRKCLPWGPLSQGDSQVQLGQSTHLSNPTREGQARQGPLEPTACIPRCLCRPGFLGPTKHDLNTWSLYLSGARLGTPAAAGIPAVPFPDISCNKLESQAFHFSYPFEKEKETECFRWVEAGHGPFCVRTPRKAIENVMFFSFKLVFSNKTRCSLWKQLLWG